MKSTPIPSATYQSEPRRETSSRRPTWLITAIFIASFVVLVLLVGRQEISRWHFASAKNAMEDRDYEAAVAASNKGLRWNPDYYDLVAIRAMAHQEQQDFEACLRDYDRMLEIAAKDGTSNELDIAPKAMKANVLQRMNRFDDSISLWNELVDYRREQFRQRDDNESRYAYAMSLNNRAYTEAQAHSIGTPDIDIARALADIQLAMDHRDNSSNDPVMLDTLGYLQLMNGLQEESLENLTRAVGLTKDENNIIRNDLKQKMREVVDQRPFFEAFKRLDEQYSIILYHRGEAYLAIGEEEKGEADKKLAIELGYGREKGIW